MDPVDDFLVVDGEGVDRTKDVAEMIRDFVLMFNNSIAALNQSTILLRDELQNALSLTLQQVKLEDTVDTQEILNSFNGNMPFTSPENVRRDYVKRLCSQLMVCETEKRSLQSKCESLEASCHSYDEKNQLVDISTIVDEIEDLVRTFPRNHSDAQADDDDSITTPSDPSRTSIEKRLRYIRDRLRLLNIPSISASVAAQTERTPTPKVLKNEKDPNLHDKNFQTKLAARTNLSKSSLSLNDLSSQEKFQLQMMQMLEQDEKFIPRRDSSDTPHSDVSELYAEKSQNENMTKPEEAKLCKTAEKTDNDNATSADRFAKHRMPYPHFPGMQPFPPDFPSRRFVRPQAFFQMSPDALSFGYYRREAYEYPLREHYNFRFSKPGPQEFHPMFRARMPRYPPVPRAASNPGRVSSAFVSLHQQSQKKGPRTPAWIPDFLPELS